MWGGGGRGRARWGGSRGGDFNRRGVGCCVIGRGGVTLQREGNGDDAHVEGNGYDCRDQSLPLLAISLATII